MGRGDQISPEVKEKIEQSLEDPTFAKQVEKERKKKNAYEESQS
jgi:stalled ribosome alternative rescue factor ArfA